MTDQRPTAAGMYDYYLGGTAHSPADQAAAQRIAQLVPEIRDGAWANRGFLQRAVIRMAAEFGVRQFLDIGAGLPTQRNTHEVATDAAPGCRVVYVDVDRAAAARGSELLAGVPEAVMIRADIREPDRILGHPQTRRLIDFTEPVGVLIVSVLQYVPDDDDPWGLVRRYLDAVVPGSYLALSHGSGDHASEQLREIAARMYADTPTPPTDRTRTEIERFFRGLEIVPPYPGAAPDVTFVGVWGADDPEAADTDGSRLAYAAVARKP